MLNPIAFFKFCGLPETSSAAEATRAVGGAATAEAVCERDGGEELGREGLTGGLPASGIRKLVHAQQGQRGGGPVDDIGILDRRQRARSGHAHVTPNYYAYITPNYYV